MRIEKCKYKDKEIEISILDDEGIEQNELEDTINLKEILEEVSD